MDIFHIIIGTAGHIDHGKSSLIRALTSIDPDRLKEEKERGLTIDLGFAPLQLSNGKKVGIIDVPGHEKFIKNMVAGATSIDFVILVIAADDGIMPQTREHMEIMQLLGIKSGMVALTKIDAVEEDLVEIALEEIEEFLQGTFLQDAPIIPVSSTKKIGIETFQEELYTALKTVEDHREDGVFRMPIQRVFSSHGYGTIITGVPISGKVQVGDYIEILPGGQKGRIRKIQAYSQDVSSAQAGHSTALNVKDLDYKKIYRGQTAATPDYFHTASFFEAKFTYLGSANAPLKHNTPIRFHVGTLEEMGKIAILGKDTLQPGEECYVQIRLENPAVAAIGDNFVVRLSSPMITIGGGVIIGMGEKKLKRFKEKIIVSLEKKESALDKQETQLELALKNKNSLCSQKYLAKALQLSKSRIEELLHLLLEQNRIIQFDLKYIHKENFERAQKKLQETLEDYFQKNSHRIYAKKSIIQNNLNMDSGLWDIVLKKLLEDKKVEQKEGRLYIPGREITLHPNQQKNLENLRKNFLENLFSPPSLEELAKINSEEEIKKIYEFLIDKKELIEVAKGLYFHKKAIEKAKQIITEIVSEKKELKVGDFRDKVESSRKYIIPLLEYFDKIGFTLRQDNRRMLRNK